ncbi:MAG: hypothetical protein COB67_05550 [SAR324 cluster bacterium]|uniref:Uncharacterized protein n=1 Tax=SAR324 cluster bacterium TaxID=2024889 RepID=A0A2A4T6R1_9DELT|nr:MAG: hypothetical protein COB67_05550 [SAR324 cluster bacterium]
MKKKRVEAKLSWLGHFCTFASPELMWPNVCLLVAKHATWLRLEGETSWNRPAKFEEEGILHGVRAVELVRAEARKKKAELQKSGKGKKGKRKSK